MDGVPVEGMGVRQDDLYSHVLWFIVGFIGHTHTWCVNGLAVYVNVALLCMQT